MPVHKSLSKASLLNLRMNANEKERVTIQLSPNFSPNTKLKEPIGCPKSILTTTLFIQQLARPTSWLSFCVSVVAVSHDDECFASDLSIEVELRLEKLQVRPVSFMQSRCLSAANRTFIHVSNASPDDGIVLKLNHTTAKHNTPAYIPISQELRAKHVIDVFMEGKNRHHLF